MEILALTFVLLGFLASLTILGMISLLKVDNGVAAQVIDALKDLIRQFFRGS